MTSIFLVIFLTMKKIIEADLASSPPFEYAPEILEEGKKIIERLTKGVENA